MRCGHLFNGIGGFALAARWMGWQNVWHSEIDEFCNNVMKQHFPESTQYGDIKKTDWTKAETVDLITGGFPCQPFSQAGRRGGTEDDRYLWPEMFAVIESLSPRWVVAENVYGIVNWNEGLVLDTVLSDLEGEGYQTGTYILPAAGTNAPHRRYRTWIVAYAEGARGRGIQRRGWEPQSIGDKRNGNARDATDTEVVGQEPSGRTRARRTGFENGNATDTEQCGRPQDDQQQQAEEPEYAFPGWGGWPTQPPVCRGNDGIPNRVDRIKALGNAIVPQVAHQIFKAIRQYELEYNKELA